ncbi:carbamoyl-phosphate synthase large subunit [Ereboglobus sp. PH5-10]|uniref:carbamoyl-phosphate synthase large subunit n=1 Tax=Ereboglobus sp. PH5-10 TaxID=2940629 RepID=UPI0024062302|nr:carbamoyl-phosphate synthase large subunit [Ereboglobus sp. PH5-10]MDF9826172.1 carbamoyl-phosphate synthase large subunit [Ereboglobus sp. PH5-10]
MAKRDDIHKVLIIGSGPIVIGQACEFDYSGTQACKALRACGYKIVLVNSNPATIMTDPVMADATYIEPLNVERLEQIIAKEKPDALLPNLGGQTGLNLSIALSKAGILAKYNVRVIGVNLDAIERGEDREVFKETMRSLGIGLPDSRIIHTVEQAEQAASELNYPVVVRPAYTMGGAGGGLVYNIDELRAIVTRGLDLSLTRQCLIEQSILGWEELEVEVVRDATGKMVTVCFIENVDAVGVHTGDSFCTAPMLTIPVEVQQECQRIAFKVVESIGVIGGTNVQLARDPKTGRIVIIEINPRTSRSSALASKATGFPIALVSAQLAAGHNLADLPYWRDGTLDKYTPSGDYVVVKFARWAFEKFKSVQDKLGTQMKAVGEVMSIGKTYKEAFQKAIRSLENGRSGLGFAKNFNDLSKDELLAHLRTPTSERHYVMYEALRKGATVDEVHAITHVKAWFIEQMLELVQLEEKILAHATRDSLPGSARVPRADSGVTPESSSSESSSAHASPNNGATGTIASARETRALPSSPEFDALLKQAKLDGFADKYLAKLLGVSEKQIRDRRVALGLVESWEAVPVSGVENAAYYFSTYGAPDAARPCVPTANPKKVMILGGGPNRIGQGIEFDYCCVHAAFALRDAGYETIMVNCNPETVSTDYDTSDKLYFEPLTVEDVLQIYNKEKPFGVVVQFGGQTPLNIARELAANGVNILGTSIDSIDDAEDRDLFRHKMERLEIPMPESGMASTFDEAKAIADKIGYPIMIRPSFILGGRGMEVIYDEDMLREYVAKAIDVSPERPLLLDRFLQSALECEADALADGKDVFIPAVMQHIELAGVHSGDSACVIPPVSIDPKHLETINTYTRKIAQELKVVGLMNMQYAIENDKVYVLEANPRASRTVPLVSKVCNVQMARIATQLMLGATIPSMNLAHKTIPHYGVKESVLPFDKFPEVDPILGPEMRSTGEVLGLSADFGLAFCKAQEAAQSPLPSAGTVLMSVWERTPQVIDIARTLVASGFKLRATVGTRAFLAEHDIAADLAIKIGEGRPDIPDDIKNGLVQFIVNSPISKRASKKDDSYIRKAAIKHRVPYMTTLAAAHAAAKGIAVKIKNPTRPIYSLQEYHANIK